MLFHFPAYPANLSGPLHFVQRATALGQWGVDLFFVLSGFLITRILLDAKGQRHYFTNFYVRRILRIFPLYYATLICFIVLIPMISRVPVRWDHLAIFSTYTQGFPLTFTNSSTDLPLNPLWSLAVEEHFYLIWPVVILLVPRRGMWYVLAGIISAAFAVRVVLLMQGFPVFYWTFSRFDAIAAGAAVALLLSGRRGGTYAKLGLMALTVLAIPVGLLYVKTTGSGIPAFQATKFFLIDGVFAILVMSVVELDGTKWTALLLESRLLRLVGKYSYAMYILHTIVFGYVLGTIGFTRFPLNFAASFLGTFGLAALSWYGLESRALSLKRFFQYHGRAPSVAGGLAQPGRRVPISTLPGESGGN